jgi:hypothetical protein
MRITCRFYDEDFIDMAEEILAKRADEFSSKDELCKRAAEKEIRRMYNELYDNKKIFPRQIDEADLSVRVDQNFILLNIILKLVCALHNIEIDKLCGRSLDPENIEDGIYDDLPQRFEKSVKELFRN